MNLIFKDFGIEYFYRYNFCLLYNKIQNAKITESQWVGNFSDIGQNLGLKNPRGTIDPIGN